MTQDGHGGYHRKIDLFAGFYFLFLLSQVFTGRSQQSICCSASVHPLSLR